MSSVSSASFDPSVHRVEARPRDLAIDRDMRIAAALSDLLDSKFSIGGVRFGLDSIVGLIPGIGDVATGVVSLYPIYLAARHDLGGWTIARMLGNVLIDAAVGAIPLLGDIFDVAFKANRRNYRLLRAAVERRYGRRFPGIGHD